VDTDRAGELKAPSAPYAAEVLAEDLYAPCGLLLSARRESGEHQEPASQRIAFDSTPTARAVIEPRSFLQDLDRQACAVGHLNFVAGFEAGDKLLHLRPHNGDLAR
jgi:hypothetical protein